MTRSAARLGRFGGALLALATTLLLIPAFSGVALADTFTADQLFDARDSKPGDGRCDVSAETGGRQCTLRAAIQESNALDGRDTVVLIGGTYLLTLQNIDGNGDGFPDPEQRAATGDLDVRDETTVRGAGLDETIVQNTVNDRHFYLQRRITNAAISGLTLINGNSVDGTNSGRGGGIFSLGTLLLEDVALRQNQAFFGGAIDNRGTLIMRSSTVSNNVGTLGGGLYNEGQLAINDSTIANNTANRGVGDNGGLGGGLYNTTAPVKLTNSTIASNTAEVRGGGIANISGDTQLLNVTVNQNTSPEGASIANSGGRTYLENTIVANGTGGDNCSGARTISRGNNLGDDTSCNLDERGDREGADPRLSPIQDDDDPLAQIYEPQAGSPAIDTADREACPAFDQRALKRPKDGDGNGVPACDVGSVEVRPQSSTQGSGV
ncbi:MAG: hypothetical protein H0U91_08855 [Rubrobacter sp.]|nr:hypothetical protein [Rubrobacter sp.]MDQ3376164.1 hypothetical protein [Actinomycetota bacterium]